MGIIFSRFRKKESTKEILGKIHDEITLLHEAKENTEQSRRKLRLYIIYAWVWIIIGTVILYFYFAPSTVRDKLRSAIPGLILIFMIFCTKYCFNYIYQWKLKKNDKKMKSLKEKKSKILEDVMETETYKVAKEILETYAPEALYKNLSYGAPIIRKKEFQKIVDKPEHQLMKRNELPTPVIKTPYVIKDSCSEVRRRLIATPGISNIHSSLGQRKNQDGMPLTAGPANLISFSQSAKVGSSLSTPVRVLPNISQTRLYDNSPTPSELLAGPLPPGPPMPRPVLPRERGVFERFIEYLVGDGPSNRYALVCRQCESHNGMALREEFEYLAFRCVYCHYWNPAKKQRPTAPKIADVSTLSSQLQQALYKNKSDSEKYSSSEDSEIESFKPEDTIKTDEKLEKMDINESENEDIATDDNNTIADISEKLEE